MVISSEEWGKQVGAIRRLGRIPDFCERELRGEAGSLQQAVLRGFLPLAPSILRIDIPDKKCAWIGFACISGRRTRVRRAVGLMGPNVSDIAMSGRY